MERKGGVTNYLDLLKNNVPSDKIEFQHFTQGGKAERGNAFFSPILLLFQLVSFVKAIRKFKPDIIHINPSLSRTALIRDVLFLRVARLLKCRVLFFIHGWNENTVAALHNRFFWKKIVLPWMKMANGYVVLASQFKQELIDMGFQSETIIVSSTMVKGDDYYLEPKEFNEKLHILFCAQMVEEKGPYVVLEAGALVLKSHPDLQFVFIGKGADLDSLKVKAKELGIQKHVRFTGFISLEEKIREFKDANIFVFPTMHGEGFPTVILEAMAAALPVITTPIAGLIDAIDDGVHGYLIPVPPDPLQIAERINALCKDRELLKAMSYRNLDEVRKKYDAHIVSSSIESMYREISRDR